MFVTRSPQSGQVLGLPSRPLRRRRSRDWPRWGAGFHNLRGTVMVRWHSTSLDRQLADGVEPQASPLLAARAASLTTPRSRTRIAQGLAGALRTAQDPRPGFTSALPPQADELLDARVVVATMERRLANPEPVGARGVAMLAQLLSDAASPLYQRGEPGLLGSHLRAAAAALESTDRSLRDDYVRAEPIGR